MHCPICGNHFRKFVLFGVNRKCCPACGSVERHRALWLYLRDNTDFFTAQKRVLHFAPKLCLRERFSRMSNLKYLTADLDSARAGEQIDITDIPCADGSFDVVLCSHVLEHVPDDRTALAELKRVLADGGFTALQIPVDYERAETYEPASQTAQERLKLFGQKDHVRTYGRDVKERIAAVGFVVEVMDFSKLLSPEDVHCYGLEKDSVLYICRK